LAYGQPAYLSAARVLGEKVAVYPVDARGLVTSFTPGFAPPGLGVMADLAAAPGGRAFYNNNDLKGAIRRAVDDGSVSYALGFYPDAASLDGKFHQLKVRVSRPGVQALYPARYLASPAMPSIEA
jgi:VWFA-related protein